MLRAILSIVRATQRVLLAVAVAVGGACTSNGTSEDSVAQTPTNILPGSFGLCVDEPGPFLAAGPMSLDGSVVKPGGQVTIRWDLEDPDELLHPDVVIHCWTGERWAAVWVARDVFYTPTASLVEPGEDIAIEDVGFRLREGVIAVPDSAPDGTYRVTSSYGEYETGLVVEG